MLLTIMFIQFGIVERALELTLILALVNMERVSVFLSTSNSPPHRLAMDSKVLVFHESKGRPRM